MRHSMNKEGIIFRGAAISAGIVCTSILWSYGSRALSYVQERVSPYIPKESLQYFTPTLLAGVALGSQIFMTASPQTSSVMQFAEKSTKGLIVYVPTIISFGLIEQLLYKLMPTMDQTLHTVVKYTACIMGGGTLGVFFLDNTNHFIDKGFILLDALVQYPFALSVVTLNKLIGPVNAEYHNRDVTDTYVHHDKIVNNYNVANYTSDVAYYASLAGTQHNETS